MQLKVLLPTQVLVDEPVSKVVAEGEDGSFCLLPRHVDFTSALVPGLLVFEPAGGGEERPQIFPVCGNGKEIRRPPCGEGSMPPHRFRCDYHPFYIEHVR